MSSEELIQCLRGTLDPNPNTRVAAELALSRILTVPEAGSGLASVSLSQNVDLSIRKSAALALRRLINEHWSPYFSTFKGSAPSHQVKTQIREMITQGISDPNSQIRTLFAHVLSTLAHSDWPDEYPELMNHLLALISSPSPNSVHGAMQVFVEFVKSDVSEEQILPILRDLLPVLKAIILSPDRHSAVTRIRGVQVFAQCVEYLYMVKDQYPSAVKDATSNILPDWITLFRQLLAQNPLHDITNTPNWDGVGMKMHVFRTINMLHTTFPGSLTSSLPELLDVCLNHLELWLPTFVSHYVLNSMEPPTPSDDGDAISLPQTTTAILEFMTNASRGGKAKQWFGERDHLNAAIRAIFYWAQITKNDEENWELDLGEFLDNEDEDSDVIGPRTAGFDLIESLFERSGVFVSKALQQCSNAFLQASVAARQAGETTWWRHLEAMLACCSSNATDVLEFLNSQTQSQDEAFFNPLYLLTDVIPPLLSLHDYPYLQGRSLIFASKYCSLTSVDIARQYVVRSVEILESRDSGIHVKLSAVKALRNICEAHNDSVIGSEAARIANVLGSLVLATEDDTLSVVLDTFITLLKVHNGNWLSTNLAASIATAFLETWSKNSKDPVLSSLLEDNFEALASSRAPGVYATTLSLAIPALCNAISSPNQETWLQTSAIDFITGLLRGDPSNGPHDVFAAFAPTLFQCMQATADRDVLQAGVACLTQMIRKDVNQVLQWRSSEGLSGADHVLTVIARLLSPTEDEAGGLVVGDLIIHFLHGAGEAIRPVLPNLLQAMITRMATAKTATFLQSLIIPFALLIHTRRDETLDFLEGCQIDTPSVSTTSGLAILLRTWCENAETIQGMWASRMNTLALCQLFLSERASLQEVSVQGDMIIRPETRDVIVTRSRAKKTPHQFTMIPFPIKAIKLLLHDLQTDGDAAAITAQDAAAVDSDDGDEDWEDEGGLVQGFKPEEFALLSDLLGPKGKKFEDDDMIETDDEDFKEFPLSSIDMKAHLLQFFKECSARNINNFANLIQHLSTEETLVLRRAVDS